LQIRYCCTYWGSEKDTPDVFVNKVLLAGYNGIEIFLPFLKDKFTEAFIEEVEGVMNKNADFLFIAQHIVAVENSSIHDYINKVKKNLTELSAFQPSFINAHTGKDYFSFDDNCRLIEAALNISNKTGIRILHETHRGRFSYHAASLLPYLQKFPEMELVGDFSHFCTVSESMLVEQEEMIQQIIPHIAHIHARVGHEQGPQVNDPFAPEWENHFKIFEKWWEAILQHKEQKNTQTFSITPEFGPLPYMPSMPYTKQPLSNQWDLNIKMMHHLKIRYKNKFDL
jgi:sugar phosphate isomerase/epimerase